jgi:von Willebrand factor A domain-containing protein 8
MAQCDWAESPLLFAARTGQVCILDGVEKLSRDCFATLQAFLTDREVSLPDGTKYIQPSSSEDIPTKVRSSFRVIALASITPSGSNSTAPTWLSEDAISMFSTIVLPAPSRQCIQKILQPVNKLSDSDLDRLLNFHERLLVSADDCGVSPMSLRTMKRIVKKGKLLEGGSLYEQVCTSLLTELLQPTKRAALESLLRSCKIIPNKSQPSKKKKIRVEFDDDNCQVRIGAVAVTPLTAKNLQLVPSPVFWDIPSHLRIIQTLLSEWTVGERAFLLLGNQGTGKNKICDRLCELLNHEREYIQLHRDTTIGQLTISPSLENGQIVWNDSPLVRAVIYGRALVIDEADKAPLEVVAVLKSLVEDGELLLADGRRILRNKSDNDRNEGNRFLLLLL